MLLKLNRRLSIVLSLSLISGAMAANPAASMAQAQPPSLPKGVVRVTSVEGITEYRLENGLKVLLFPDQSKQTITVKVTYEVGSKNENYGETGMAHLLEHLMFKGSPKHTNIPQEMSEHGGPAPWDAEQVGPGGELRRSLSELVGPARQNGRFGTPEQTTAAVAAIKEATAKLYKILAEG